MGEWKTETSRVGRTDRQTDGQTDVCLYCLMLSVGGLFLRSTHKHNCYSDSMFWHLPVATNRTLQQNDKQRTNQLTNQPTNQPINIPLHPICVHDNSTIRLSVIGRKECVIMSHRLPSDKAPRPRTAILNVIKLLLFLFDDVESLKKATYSTAHGDRIR